MYGLAALIGMTATYVLIRINQSKGSQLGLWIAYALLMAALLYTHYFAGLLIAVHWLYMFMESRRKHPKANRRQAFMKLPKVWWGANIAAAALFAPWLPTFLTQAGKVNTGFWIGAVSRWTFPETTTTLVLLRSFWTIPPVAKGLFFVLVGGFALAAGQQYRAANKQTKQNIMLLGSYLILPALILFVASASPLVSVYYVRYFSLFAVGFYAFIGVICARAWLVEPNPTKQIMALLTLGVLISGVVAIYQPAEFADIRNDRFAMKRIVKQIAARGARNDVIVNTDLGTYFDARYYNPTNQTVRVHNDEPANPYGNWSLVYDRDEIMNYDYGDITSPSGYVWFISGSDLPFPKLPSNWQADTPVLQDGYAKFVRYRIR